MSPDPNPSFAIAVVMAKIAIESRWQSHKWQPDRIMPDTADGAGPTLLVETAERTEVLHPGFSLHVYPDEAEGYYLNVSSPDPRVFVMWRVMDESLEDSPLQVLPHSVTLSYNEAARWMDAQEKVDGVDMPQEILAALSQWVEGNYKPPEKKQRIRPRSFESKEGRYKGGMSS
jgi:hypothetical protein